ncbi:hypothetical protein [Megasphaera stantonii]|uniref:Uncharacterized protein n=1 Tax=Megasphaera stantonii TaxID=2144175 RepID=A0A346AZN1_9FIRM|nr:hypothetical protein [Megasphaera stantonii]AXL21324.1 hypothetical protein DKB62_06990 [Megasphaera stantonii]
MNIQKINELLEAQASTAKTHQTQPASSSANSETTFARQPASAVVDMTQQQLVSRLLQPDADYGLIQGCRKPSLFKSGAEKLAAHYQLRSEVSVLHRTEDIPNQFVSYEIKVTLYNQAGAVVSEGLGAANSKERKFSRGDFYSSINTVIKMARKRAFIDAVLTGTATSGIFTQDMEDIASPPTEIHRIG